MDGMPTQRNELTGADGKDLNLNEPQVLATLLKAAEIAAHADTHPTSPKEEETK